MQNIATTKTELYTKFLTEFSIINLLFFQIRCKDSALNSQKTGVREEKCKKMQKNLRMSKKSSNFAAAFEKQARLPSSVGRATDS